MEGGQHDTLDVMSKIKFQALTTREDLLTYQRKTAEQVSVTLPMAYLSKARVIGLKDEDSQQIYGGFTMAYQGPLRCLEQLPLEVQQNNPFLNKYRDQFFEINGMWLNHKMAPENSRLQLYLSAMREASLMAMQGKSKYVYAYCAENKKLRDFYRNFNSFEIYEGPVSPLPGMGKAGLERVEMGCMKRLPITILRNPLFLVKRATKNPYRALQATYKRVSEDLKGKMAI